MSRNEGEGSRSGHSKTLTKRDKLMFRLAGALVESPGASLEKLAEIAETSRGTLYRVARSREELVTFLRGYVASNIGHVMDDADLDGEDPRAILLKLARGFVRYPDLCAFSANSSYLTSEPNLNGTKDIEADYRIRMEAFFAKWQRAGYFRPDFSPIWLVLLFDYTLQAASEGIRKGLIASAHAGGIICNSFLAGTQSMQLDPGETLRV